MPVGLACSVKEPVIRRGRGLGGLSRCKKASGTVMSGNYMCLDIDVILLTCLGKSHQSDAVI